MSVSAFSYDIEVEGLTYNLKKVDDEIYAELEGRAYAVDPNGYITYKTDVIIPSEVTYGARTYTVKGIGPCAFAPDISGNYAITSLFIPKTIEYMHPKALMWYLGGGDYSITELSSLTSIRVADDNPHWDSREDCNCLIETESNTILMGCGTSHIPSSVVAINDYAFTKAGFSGEVVIPAGITHIGNYAFSYSTMNTLTIEANLKEIPKGLCNECKSLTSVKLNESITHIGTWAFARCSKLQDINWPSSLSVIEENAFLDCTSLQSISLSTAAEVRTSAFEGCRGLTSVDMPHVERIGVAAFRDCSNLTVVSLPALREFMGTAYAGGCFSNCRSLRQVTLSDELTYIPSGCFSGCSSLEEIVIPAGINRIGENAFQGCTKLSHVKLLTQTPPEAAAGAFSTQTKHTATLYVPEGTKLAYQASEQWNEFYFIEEFDATGINAPQAPQTVNSKSVNRKCFDLSGRRLSVPPAHGLYIEDGTLKAK